MLRQPHIGGAFWLLLFQVLCCCNAFLLPSSPSPSPLPRHQTKAHHSPQQPSPLSSSSFSSSASFYLALKTILIPSLVISTPLIAQALPQKPPETNAQMLLIEALPNKNAVITDLASSLSKITTEGSGNIRSIDSKGSKGIKPWPEVSKAARGAQGLLSGRSKELMAGVKSGNEDAAQAELATLKASVDALGAAAEVQDRPSAVQAQVRALKALDKIGSLEQSFPFKPPTEEYPGIPQLLGRAEVEFTVRTGKTRQTRTMNAILDGYSAPLSTGHFVDLVQKKVFDKAPIINTDESSVTFAPAAKDAVKRNVPLEILVEGDKEPVYGESLEEQGRFKDKVVLPFSAYGTLAFQHSPDDVNSNSGTLFFLKSDPSYTPAGINTLDGAWSVLGYVVEGEDALDDLLQGDEVISVRVVDGAQNLKI